MPSANTSVNAYIEKLKADHFWGTIELKFQDGKVVLLTTTTTVKVEPLPL